MTSKIFLTLIIITTLILPEHAFAEIIPISEGNSIKHLPSSAMSYYGDFEDGTLVCWYDENFNGALFVQKIGTDGKCKWNKNGVIADSCLGYVFTGESDYPDIYSDDAGGAVVIYRKTFNNNEEIYFAKIFSNGSISGRPVCISSGFPGLKISPNSIKCSDNSIAVTWENFYNGDFNIYAQKIDMNGVKKWNRGNDVIVCNESHDQRKPVIDCNGYYVYITWLDDRIYEPGAESGYSLYGNVLYMNGNYTSYSDKGKLIFANINSDNSGAGKTKKISFYNHNMVLSDNNSVMIALEKQLLDVDSYVKVIKVDEYLNVRWEYDIEAESYQSSPLIVSDGSYGACIFWNDSRKGKNAVYGLRISPEGEIIAGGHNGTIISYDESKENLRRCLPAVNLKYGIYKNENIVHLSWTTGERGNLFYSALDLNNNLNYKNYNEVICSKNADAGYNSVSDNKFNSVVVYRESGNIFANIISKKIKRKISEEDKISSYNYPNPFNPTTRIFYTIPEDGYVKLSIFNSAGQEIAELGNSFLRKGSYSAVFNAGKNETGTYGTDALSSGIYFYHITFHSVNNDNGDLIQTKRMVLVK